MFSNAIFKISKYLTDSQKQISLMKARAYIFLTCLKSTIVLLKYKTTILKYTLTSKLMYEIQKHRVLYGFVAHETLQSFL